MPAMRNRSVKSDILPFPRKKEEAWFRLLLMVCWWRFVNARTLKDTTKEMIHIPNFRECLGNFWISLVHRDTPSRNLTTGGGGLRARAHNQESHRRHAMFLFLKVLSVTFVFFSIPLIFIENFHRKCRLRGHQLENPVTNNQSKLSFETMLWNNYDYTVDLAPPGVASVWDKWWWKRRNWNGLDYGTKIDCSRK